MPLSLTPPSVIFLRKTADWLCKSVLLSVLLACTFLHLPAQSKKPVDVDFLFHYYDQEGQHSAVTGGTGTEMLIDRAGDIIAVIPLDSTQSLQIDAHLNHYTSASTDNIDSNVSSASRRDNHATLRMAWSRIGTAGRSWGLHAGMGIESDYFSRALGGFWSLDQPSKNRSWFLSGNLFLDNWIVIFPEELRAPGLASVPTDRRRSLSLSATLAQVIRPRWQLALTHEWILQQGLLSTPFHRVYIKGNSLPRIERLPGFRAKFPLGLRLHYFAGDRWIFRLYARSYGDSFGLLAQTVSLEVPFKPTDFWTLAPFGRWHIQRGTGYFAPFGETVPEALFYTSDFDLSSFQAYKYGLRISYAPLYGLLRWKSGPKRFSSWRSIDVRGSRYLRSDGLQAWTIGLALGFSI